ncbi:HEAT repeat domain-containing protein, partial [Stenotrophomonas maltophilia]|uniref:HEAT repeat domain-containing protein n=1 Tax=Stenotrophomonas maltophilia TaxID=40324 RepID=UPI003CCFEC82
MSDAIAACGHLYGPRETIPVIAFATHPDPDVRFSVAVALLGHQQAAAIDALIMLSADANGDVRNWATFGLG